MLVLQRGIISTSKITLFAYFGFGLFLYPEVFNSIFMLKGEKYNCQSSQVQETVNPNLVSAANKIEWKIDRSIYQSIIFIIMLWLNLKIISKKMSDDKRFWSLFWHIFCRIQQIRLSIYQKKGIINKNRKKNIILV